MKENVKAVKSVEPKVARRNASPLNEEPILYHSKRLDEREVLKKTTPHRKNGDGPNQKNWGSSAELIEKRKKAFAQYQRHFDQKTYRQFSTKLNGYSEADICWVLDHCEEGIKNYFVRLIREDMKRNPKKTCYQIPEDVVKKSKLIKDLKKDGYSYSEAIEKAESL